MYKETKQKIINVCCQLVEEGLIYDTAGNISVRMPKKNYIIITPSNIPYASMTTDNLPVLDLNGNFIEEGLKPSVETPMHLAILNSFPEANAVIHTHSKFASSFSINRVPIDTVYLLSLMVGFTPVADYGESGSLELAQNAVKAMKDHNTYSCLLANHGALVYAKNLDLAHMMARYLEKTAELQHIAMSHGKMYKIPEEEITKFQGSYLV